MNQPWGLSGPQFLGIYGAGMAAFFAVPFLPVLLARVFGTASSLAPSPVLDAYEVGYLAGGAQRAAEVVIGELSASGALRVDSAGQVSQADPAQLAAWSATCAHGIAAQAVPDGLRAQKVRDQLAKDPGVVAIGVRLRADGLLIARSWVIAVRVTALALWLALIAAGALRLAEGSHNHRPTGDLGQLFFLTLLLGLASLDRLKRLQWAQTRAGAGYLKQLGQQEVAKQAQAQLSAYSKEQQAARQAERKARRAERHALRRGGSLPASDSTIASPAFAEATVLEQETAGPAPALPAASLPGLAGAGGEAALLGIALGGLAALQDSALRTALLAGLPSSGGGGGGGGGCGGGGCGG
jgi:uncharacterized protein (TIGR04222 family)